MNIFGKLFGSDKVIDAGISAIDAMVYTDEEKAINRMKFLKLYEPFKIAQRYIAIIVTIPYMIAWFGTFCASFFMNVDAQQLLLSGSIGTIVMLITSFYFAGGALGGLGKVMKYANKGEKK